MADMEALVGELKAEKKQLETDNWELEEKVSVARVLGTCRDILIYTFSNMLCSGLGKK